MSEFPTVFSPLRIGAHTVRNRIVCSAHGEQWSREGLLNERMITYYERRAAGGAGMLICFGSASVYKGAAGAGLPALWDERNAPFLTDMAARVHARGAVLLAQATHRGTRESPAGADNPLQAPSPLPASVKQGYLGAPHVLTIGEIAEIVESYAAVAERLHRCGWDGIELTTLGSHLMEQFWSPTMNTRTDRYGGSFENRMRFSLEIIDRITQTVPRSFLVCFRISGDPVTDLLGLTSVDMGTIADVLASRGRIDFFNVSGGSGVNMETHAAVVPNDTYATGTYIHLARAMKQRLALPVLVAGRILTPADAEAALAGGNCDLVAMTRALIAEPELPHLAEAGMVERIRPCIAINEGCRRVTMGKSHACSVNPGVADAALDDLHPAAAVRQISVIGGGPGGMEAARVAAARGHAVTLYERSDRLGGQMHDYAKMVGLPHLLGHVEWLEREIRRLGVTVELGRDISSGDLAAWNPEATVVATGACTAVPPEGRGLAATAVTDVDGLAAAATLPPGRAVLVYDIEGRSRGASIAAKLKEAGAVRVELVFPHQAPMENLEPPNKPALYRRLASVGIECHPNQILVGPQNDSVRARGGISLTSAV